MWSNLTFSKNSSTHDSQSSKKTKIANNDFIKSANKLKEWEKRSLNEFACMTCATYNFIFISFASLYAVVANYFNSRTLTKSMMWMIGATLWLVNLKWTTLRQIYFFFHSQMWIIKQNWIWIKHEKRAHHRA